MFGFGFDFEARGLKLIRFWLEFVEMEPSQDFPGLGLGLSDLNRLWAEGLKLAT